MNIDSFVLLLRKIPVYKGASEAIIPINLENIHFYGMNGFGDLDYWKPHYPKNIDMIVPKQHAIEIIRDLVMKVYFIFDRIFPCLMKLMSMIFSIQKK